MVEDGDYIAIFNSIHRVLKGEKILKEMGLKILLIPAPRAVSSDCGLAIRYSATDRSRIEAVLQNEGLTPEEIYLKENDTYSKVRT